MSRVDPPIRDGDDLGEPVKAIELAIPLICLIAGGVLFGYCVAEMWRRGDWFYTLIAILVLVGFFVIGGAKATLPISRRLSRRTLQGTATPIFEDGFLPRLCMFVVSSCVASAVVSTSLYAMGWIAGSFDLILAISGILVLCILVIVSLPGFLGSGSDS
ncbi:MAG: hypothetical protein AAGB29_08715 [Planctomycetota bacterium]